MDNRNSIKARVDYLFANEFNHTLHAYIDVTGDLVAGTLFSQIMYWFSSDKNGKRKVRVQRDGYYWLAKKRDDWYSEIRISPKQYDRAAKILVELGFIEVKRFKFGGEPVTHIRPIYENINKATQHWKANKAKELIKNSNFTDGEILWDSKAEDVFFEQQQQQQQQSGNSNLTDGEIPTLPMGKHILDEWGSSLTENTTEIKKTEIKDNNIYINSTELTETDSRSSKIEPAKNQRLKEYEAEFDTLWKLYPRKQGKPAAKKHYLKARKDGVEYKTVETALLEYKEYIQLKGLEDQYIKQGGTWFNGYWEDDYSEEIRKLKERKGYGVYERHTGSNENRKVQYAYEQIT